MMHGHGGDLKELARKAGRPVDDILDFSANINPLGPPAWLRAVISRHVESLVHYPDPGASLLAEALARRHAVAREELIVGNGSSELLYLLPRALDVERAVIPVPSYIDYANAARVAGLKVKTVPLSESNGFKLDFGLLDSALRDHDVVFLGQPNNPTGFLFDAEAFRGFVKNHPSTVFVVDEAFADFVDHYETLAAKRASNVVVVRSMTKFYAIPGLRLGYAVADADIVKRMKEMQAPWSVNTLARAIGETALGDDEYAQRTRAFVAEQREKLGRALRSIPGLAVYPGRANFLLVRIERPAIAAPQLAELLLQREGIAIRVCSNFDCLDDRFFRVAVRTNEENERLCRAVELALGKHARPTGTRKTAALMFQGTTSSAGKSVLTAALCRILLQDGYRVAPFKAQNMSLNSFVTRDGGEIGRAQAMQAQACKIEPDVRVNPILLKPTSDTGSQVIVRGKPVGNISAAEYPDYATKAFEVAKESYDSLTAEYDVVVLEGAGSPAEVNLKHRDIANMRMARHAKAPVLLIGDIDRGGVYAAFVGTMEVLEEWERALVQGFVVNRFRGDPSFLGPAHDYVLRHTGRPVLGVVPYLSQLFLPQEDSVEFKSGTLEVRQPIGEAVEIAVVDLPHISNFTDFDALRLEPDVRLRVVRSAAELHEPDAVVLPGSKNVIGDLAYLKQSGLAERIVQLARKAKTDIIGICGGFQMLGSEITDPHHLESSAGHATGFGLLPVSTVLALEKTLLRVDARHEPSGLPVSGYEIHHGQTSADNLPCVFRRADGKPCGASTPDYRIWGTYLHGVFDADQFRRWFIDRLRERRGMEALGKVLAIYDLEPTFDRLAQVVRENLRIDQIYRMMGL
jgi:cobyric acid synthase CobQ/L-threonine-O-3-phosphate decarboxylase